MKYTPQHHDLCANTILINQCLAELEFSEKAFDHVYDKIVEIFRDELESAKCQEDIYDAIYSETSYMIDRYSFDADAHEVVKKIFSDFGLKESPQ